VDNVSSYGLYIVTFSDTQFLSPLLYPYYTTMLHARRSQVRFWMVALVFFIDTIFLVALWPWGQLIL